MKKFLMFALASSIYNYNLNADFPQPTITAGARTYKKAPLTNKQKKARVRSKASKKAKKRNR